MKLPQRTISHTDQSSWFILDFKPRPIILRFVLQPPTLGTSNLHACLFNCIKTIFIIMHEVLFLCRPTAYGYCCWSGNRKSDDGWPGRVIFHAESESCLIINHVFFFQFQGTKYGACCSWVMGNRWSSINLKSMLLQDRPSTKLSKKVRLASFKIWFQFYLRLSF